MDTWAHPQDPTQMRVDSFEAVYNQVRAGDPQGRTNSENVYLAQIISELSRTGSNDGGQMDSMESLPSSVINSALNAYERNSLPHVQDMDINQALMPEGDRSSQVLNESILVSPASYDPHREGEMMYYQMQTTPHIDPNHEIHAGPMTFNHQSEIPEQPSEPQRFTPAVTTQQHVQQVRQIPRKEDDVVSVKSSDSSDITYQLSPENRLEITVSYSSLPVCGTVTVDRPEGCVMYYKKTAKELIDYCQTVPFPTLENTEVRKKFSKVSPKALELTERALDALQGGLQLYWKPNEGVFACRKSRGKIYWTSTQMKSLDPQELSRNCEVKVFDWESFRQNLKVLYACKATGQRCKTPKLPSVIFTFAQKWCADSAPVTSCLVWSKVIPKKAEEMVLGLFPKAESASYSLNSEILKVSMEETPENYMME